MPDLLGPRRPMRPDEIKEDKKRRKSLAWWAKIITKSIPATSSDQPQFQFSEDGKKFILETGWGKVLKFNLETGEKV